MPSVVNVILAITAGLLSCQETFGQATVYMVSELSVTGVPTRLNNLGDVAGRADDSSTGETRATRWNHGSLRSANSINLGGGEYSKLP